MPNLLSMSGPDPTSVVEPRQKRASGCTRTTRQRRRRFRLTALLLCATVPGSVRSGDAVELNFERPVAATIDGNTRTLYVASQNGAITSISMEQLRASTPQAGRRLQVEGQLADLKLWPGRNALLALDVTTEQMLVVDAAESLRIVERLRLPQPWRLAISDDGQMSCVSGRWTRCVCLVALEPTGKLTLRDRIELPFPAGEVIALSEGRFLVADAFGGHLAVVDRSGAVVAQHSLHAHNIRGLMFRKGTTTEPPSVIVTHQVLSQLARAELADVHWGMLMRNVVRRIQLDDLLNPNGDLESTSRADELGDTGRGAADPAGVVALADGRLAIALSGTDEVMFRGAETTTRVPVGRRPTRVLSIPGEDTLVVVNTLSDSVSLIDPETGVARHAGSAGALTLAQKGEVAFFSARLSHDSWMSCHSCHADGHSPGLRADTLGDASYGTPKRIPSLLGVSRTGPWAWNGHFTSLQDQVSSSLKSTMHGGDVPDSTSAAITAFLGTLQVPPAPAAEPEALAAGRAVFDRLGCAKCHAGDVFTSAETYDVGLRDEQGLARFNPPSLRGAGHRRAFFHDGRATSLEAVFREEAHQLRGPLPESDLHDLVRFLRSL